MKKSLFLVLLTLFCTSLVAVEALAYGDGYTDCERDSVYERDFMAKPTIHLYVRERACMTDSPIMYTLSPDTEYLIVAETDGWYKVQTPDGSQGWSGSGLMTKTTADTGSGQKLGPEAYDCVKVQAQQQNQEQNQNQAQFQKAYAGDVIKMTNSASLYYLGNDAKKYIFPSLDIFNTWYDDFSEVKTVSEEEFQSYGFGSNIFPRAGTRLIQATDGATENWVVVDPKIYVISGDNEIRHIKSVEIATALFGNNWGSMILPVPIQMFNGFNEGSPVESYDGYDRTAETDTANSINAVKFKVLGL